MLEKDKKRALRRHHKQRMKAKAIRVYYFHTPENAIKHADHLKVCSCYGCGNPRHYGGGMPICDLRKIDPEGPVAE